MDTFNLLSLKLPQNRNFFSDFLETQNPKKNRRRNFKIVVKIGRFRCPKALYTGHFLMSHFFLRFFSGHSWDILVCILRPLAVSQISQKNVFLC